jgi:hypothetical protein
MEAEFKRGSLEGYLLGVEEIGELNGFELAGCFKWGMLLAFLGIIVGVGRPGMFCPALGAGSPTVLGGPATEFGLFSLPGTELGSCGMREGV